MKTVRAQKWKGSQFEYSCQDSLKEKFPDIYRTSERGYQLQYDLRSDGGKAVFECKRLKALTWNQAKKYYLKLKANAPEGYRPYLLFKSNLQPCLVMWCGFGYMAIMEFENLFQSPWIEHKSVRKKAVPDTKSFDDECCGYEDLRARRRVEEEEG